MKMVYVPFGRSGLTNPTKKMDIVPMREIGSVTK